MNLSLKGKNALIGGSSKGIGLAAAIEMAGLGANVTIVGRNAETLSNALHLLPKNDDQHHDFLVADFADAKLVAQKISLLTATKTYHILVNNTAGPPSGLASDASPEDFLSAFNNHLICNHIITKAVVQHMKNEKFGRIINVISTSVKQPLDNLGVSNTIRGAVASWAKTLANELGPYNITVNNVLPGATMTGRLEEILEAEAKKKGTDIPSVTKHMESSIPLGRLAEPREIGAAIAFLASPAASYITGINLPVDGGRTKSL